MGLQCNSSVSRQCLRNVDAHLGESALQDLSVSKGYSFPEILQKFLSHFPGHSHSSVLCMHISKEHIHVPLMIDRPTPARKTAE